jgi:hypothetical protein
MTDDPDTCECGIPLADHPPLPKPKPLVSWHAARNVTDKYKSEQPVIRPGWRSARRKEGKP